MFQFPALHLGLTADSTQEAAADNQLLHIL
jgi:hypothetical protein